MRRFAVPLALSLVALVSLAGAPAAIADGPLDDAREAAQGVSFDGIVRVEWTDAHGLHVQRLTVRSEHGTMRVDGARDLATRAEARFVYHPGLGWAMVWPSSLGTEDRPTPSAKYALDDGPGPEVAGRSTWMVEVRRDGALWERLFLDASTGLALRREQYDPERGTRRVVTFERIDTSHPAKVSLPSKVDDQTPDTVAGDRPSAPYRAPAALASGYRLLGAYRRGATVHLLYSDGLYDLSVFEQKGRLRTRDLPASRTAVRVGGREGWRVSWAGGEVLLWQAGGAVYTVVGEAPLPDLLVAARSMPSAATPGWLERLRQTVRTLLEIG